MIENKSREAELDEPWNRLARHLRLTERHSPWLVLIFSPSETSAAWMQEKTEALLREKDWFLRTIKCSVPDDLGKVLPSLFEDSDRHPDCVWVEAVDVDPPDQRAGPWTTAWNNLLLRLNENRDKVRRHVRGGIILVGPMMLKPRMREFAPDFWSVRTMVLELPSMIGRVEAEEAPPESDIGGKSLCDVLILTALHEELDAVIGYNDAREVGHKSWERVRNARGYTYYTCTIFNERGEGLRLASACFSEMGQSTAAARSTQLMAELNPPCIMICGICSADKSAGIKLGDLIVAERVYTYDAGRHVGGKGGRDTVFYHDITAYGFDQVWKHKLEEYLRESTGWKAALELIRPPSSEAQERWLLHALFEHEHEGGKKPIHRTECMAKCPDWAGTIERLERMGLVSAGEDLNLSESGLEYMLRQRFLHPDGWPIEPGFDVHVGTMASGEGVIQDKELFEKLKQHAQKTIAVEMDAATVGYAANFLNRRALIVKGVSDYGNGETDDRFRAFACQVSAGFVLGFVNRYGWRRYGKG